MILRCLPFIPTPTWPEMGVHHNRHIYPNGVNYAGTGTWGPATCVVTSRCI